MKSFSKYLSYLLDNIIFILLGFILPLHLTPRFLMLSFLLFLIMIIIRFFAVFLSLANHNINLKEMIFMSLNCPKGIAVAAIVLILSNYTLGIPVTILNLIIMFILYSIIFSSFAAYFLQKFIRKKIEE